MKTRDIADAPRYPTPVRFSPTERAVAEQAAQVNGQTLSAFIRDATLTAAAECLEGPCLGEPGRSVVLTPSGVLR